MEWDTSCHLLVAGTKKKKVKKSCSRGTIWMSPEMFFLCHCPAGSPRPCSQRMQPAPGCAIQMSEPQPSDPQPLVVLGCLVSLAAFTWRKLVFFHVNGRLRCAMVQKPKYVDGVIFRTLQFDDSRIPSGVEFSERGSKRNVKTSDPSSILDAYSPYSISISMFFRTLCLLSVTALDQLLKTEAQS